MKKNIFQFASLTTLLIFYCGSLFAKNNYSQSTLDELKTLNGNVTKAVSENDSLAMARAYYKLALKYDYIDENDSCYLYYRKAIKIAKQINNVRAEAIISNAFATTYSDRGLHKEAIEIYDHIIKLFLSQKDSTGAGGVMLNTGAEYLEMGNYEKGLQLSLDALNIKLMSSDSSNIAGFYKQISTIFDLVGNKEKRKEYILLANQIAKKDERYSDFYIRMDILNELGGYYFNMGDYNLATKYYDTLYIKSTQKDYLVGITASTSNLVPILKTEGKYSEALVLSKKALALSQKGGKPYRIVHNLVETAKLEIILFNKNIAAKRLLNAKALAIEYNFPDELITIYKLLAEIYFDNNNFETAYKNLLYHQTLKDSIEGWQTKQIIAELETKYQTEKKDNQIEILNKDNLLKQERIETQNKTVINIIAFALFVTTLFVFIYSRTKLKSKNRVLNMHQKLLRSQMDPHFIFNALLAIQNYILKNKKFEASDYLAQFATLMRSILKGSRDDFILLSREIEILNYYVSLQQLRFENSFQFKLEIDENIETESLQIPPMLIQPFIENAIEHGLRKITDYEKILSVKYILDNNSLIILIEDNGIGIDRSKENKLESKHKSFAMEITNERLTNITKIYKTNIDIAVSDLSKFENRRGTEIKFSIPLKLLKGKND